MPYFFPDRPKTPTDDPNKHSIITVIKKKKVTSGETTTDKDTEDEKDEKPQKVYSMQKLKIKDQDQKMDIDDENNKFEQNKKDLVNLDDLKETCSNYEKDDIKGHLGTVDDMEMSLSNDVDNTSDVQEINDSSKEQKKGLDEKSYIDGKNDREKVFTSEIQIEAIGNDLVGKAKESDSNVEGITENQNIEGSKEKIKICDEDVKNEDSQEKEEDDASKDGKEDSKKENFDVRKSEESRENLKKDGASRDNKESLKIEDDDVKISDEGKEGIRKVEKALKENVKKEDEEEMIEVEDTDDYLLHLEDILKKVHAKYYEEYDKLDKKSASLPDLKVSR